MKTNDDAAKAEFGRMFGEVGKLAGEGRWAELKDCYDAVIALGESIGAPVHLIHLMFGDWLALEDPMLALHAFQEAGRTMPKDVDHEFLEQWNFGIGAQYFSLINDHRVPGGIEKALEHLEVCVEKDVNHFGMLGLLYELRQQGDLLGNWERRVSNLEAALAQINREEDPNGWARRNRGCAHGATVGRFRGPNGIADRAVVEIHGGGWGAARAGMDLDQTESRTLLRFPRHG